MKIEIIKKKLLKYFEGNPREISEEDFNSLKRSIDKFGLVDPLIIDEQNVVIGGNQRLLAAEELGIEAIPCVRVKGLSKNEKKALNIALNKISGEWDEEKLFDILKAIKEQEEDLMKYTGFDSTEFSELMDKYEEDQRTDDLDIEQAIKEPKYKIKRGEIWQLGTHRLMCGDATIKEDVEKLMDGKKADMVFTDPPYGLGGYGGRNKMALKGDDEDTTKFYQAIPEAKEMYVWGHYWNFSMLNFKPRDAIVWKKNNFGLGNGYRNQYELCFYKGEFKGSDSDVWEIDKDTKYKHPTQKPIALCTRAIKNSNPNIILDIFGGSGSTLIACEQTHRICFMMEIDPTYCSVIIERWENFTKKKAQILRD